MQNMWNRLVVCSIVVALLGVSVTGAQEALGQAATPEPPPELGEDTLHPAHIHEGTCDDFDSDPLYTLTEVDEALDPEAEVSGADTAIPVMESVSHLETELDDLLAEAHAITLAASQANPDDVIACGDIGGVVFGNTLMVGIAPVEDSGYSGIALLSRAEGGVNIVIYFTSGALN